MYIYMGNHKPKLSDYRLHKAFLLFPILLVFYREMGRQVLDLNSLQSFFF